MVCKVIDNYKIIPLDNQNREDSIIKLLNNINLKNSNKDNLNCITNIVSIAGFNKNSDELLDFLIYILTEKYNIYKIINKLKKIFNKIKDENINCTDKEYYCLIVIFSVCKYCEETFYNTYTFKDLFYEYIIYYKNIFKNVLLYIY